VVYDAETAQSVSAEQTEGLDPFPDRYPARVIAEVCGFLAQDINACDRVRFRVTSCVSQWLRGGVWYQGFQRAPLT